ncbi:hypothetical protein BDZ89DRAFT_1066139, partial [Hymenopellis radicata]
MCAPRDVWANAAKTALSRDKEDRALCIRKAQGDGKSWAGENLMGNHGRGFGLRALN